jgi:hypothetical protein
MFTLLNGFLELKYIYWFCPNFHPKQYNYLNLPLFLRFHWEINRKAISLLVKCFSKSIKKKVGIKRFFMGTFIKFSMCQRTNKKDIFKKPYCLGSEIRDFFSSRGIYFFAQVQWGFFGYNL